MVYGVCAVLGGLVGFFVCLFGLLPLPSPINFGFFWLNGFPITPQLSTPFI